MIKKIFVISAYYPSSTDPIYAFVGTLIETFADMGVECHVVSPVSELEKKHKAVSRVETTRAGAKIHVYCPRYLIFPARKIGSFHTYKLTLNSYFRAVRRVFRKHVGSCDAIYSHFINSGVAAAWLKKKTGIPAFMAVGESNITNRKLSYGLFKDILYEGLNGVITVSSPLVSDLREHDVVSAETPVITAPNAIDTGMFTRLDRQSCRDSLQIQDSDYVIAFVGGFIKRKGFDKLLEIIKRHPAWKCILIGTGDIQADLPEDQIIHCSRVDHEKIPPYLCAADVFVLPTQEEGCCNAIIEALGCGLPVISSDRSFNDDILDETCSIRVDPDNPDEIEDACVLLENDSELRQKLSDGAYTRGQQMSIENRAKKILSFMENNL